MNVDYLASMESSQSDIGKMMKKNPGSYGAEKREFKSSYQEARKQQEDKVEAAQSQAVRERRERNAAAQVNKNKRDQDNEAPSAAAANKREKEKSETQSTEGKSNGKTLPSSEKGGNLMQSNAVTEKGDSGASKQPEEALQKTFIKLHQVESDRELLAQESNDVTTSEAMLKDDVKSGLETELTLSNEEEKASPFESVVSLAENEAFTKLSVQSDEGAKNLEQDDTTAAKESAVPADEEKLLGEQNIEPGKEPDDLPLDVDSIPVTSESKSLKSSDNNSKIDESKEFVNVQIKETQLKSADDTADTKQKIVNDEARTSSAEKVDLTSTVSLAMAKKPDEANKSDESSKSDEKNKSLDSKAVYDSGYAKLNIENLSRDRFSENLLEEQSLLNKMEGNRGEAKSSLLEGLSVSELALKEAKSPLASKSLDFAKALGAEKLPLRETIELPVSHKNWGEALAEKATMLVNQRGNFARLNLVPHNLGPLEVRVQLQGETSSLEFIAVNPTTKEAIEAAIPRLREMFESGGLNLGDVNVNSQAKRDSESEKTLSAQKEEETEDLNLGTAEEELNAPVNNLLLNGRVDFYA